MTAKISWPSSSAQVIFLGLCKDLLRFLLLCTYSPRNKAKPKSMFFLPPLSVSPPPFPRKDLKRKRTSRRRKRKRKRMEKRKRAHMNPRLLSRFISARHSLRAGNLSFFCALKCVRACVRFFLLPPFGICASERASVRCSSVRSKLELERCLSWRSC